MREVFVTSHGDKYKVTCKESGKTEIVDDILLFNGVYKRYKDVKGWHGIVSEEINRPVINIITKGIFNPIYFEDKKYYPRIVPSLDPIKSAQFVRFLPSGITIRGYNRSLSSFEINDYTSEWEEESEDEEDSYDLEEDDEDDY